MLSSSVAIHHNPSVSQIGSPGSVPVDLHELRQEFVHFILEHRLPQSRFCPFIKETALVLSVYRDLCHAGPDRRFEFRNAACRLYIEISYQQYLSEAQLGLSTIRRLSIGRPTCSGHFTGTVLQDRGLGHTTAF